MRILRRRVRGILAQPFRLQRVGFNPSRCLRGESGSIIGADGRPVANIDDARALTSDRSGRLEPDIIAVVGLSYVQNCRDSHSRPKRFRPDDKLLLGGRSQ